MEEVKKKRLVSLSEVNEILGKQDTESIYQILRWAYDYVSKFAKYEPEEAKKIKEKLVKECELTEEEAVEIMNIKPTTLAEQRSFTFGWKKLILAETLNKILKIIADK